MRWVVLHHTGIPEPHFDVMVAVSADGPLRTWRARRWPAEVGDLLEPLADHRRAYLDYEGPVSGGRGEVRRVAAGQAHGLRLTGSGLRIDPQRNGFVADEQ